MTDERAFWVGFQRIAGVGNAAVFALRDHFGTLTDAWLAAEHDLLAAGLSQRLADSIVQARRQIDPSRELDRLAEHDVRAVIFDDPEYPRLLRQISQAPAILYIKGQLLPEDELAIAMVGTRRATGYGLDMARRIADGLARAGVTVISGLALGIDTVSHRAALDAGGRTIAVCGSGLDIVYPPRNRRLAAEIVDQGALVSEFPLGTRPDARNFPARNRIISGVSRGVVVIEAPRKSGALITASFAGDQGREVYAVPGSALSRASSGCHQLIRDGAALVTGANDILDDLEVARAQSAVQTRIALPSSDTEQRLYDLLGAEPRHVNELCAESGLTIQETNGLLLAMELKGLVRQQGAQHYVRN